MLVGFYIDPGAENEASRHLFQKEEAISHIEADSVANHDIARRSKIIHHIKMNQDIYAAYHLTCPINYLQEERR